MQPTQHVDQEQAKLWNGNAGQNWVESQDLLDRAFRPFEDLLVQAVRNTRGQRVLDIGCGTGPTTLAVARHLDATGRCTGVDISEPMIAAARTRAEREGASVEFICADAQRHSFETGAFDTVISRFGVMFFDDPVRAFQNLHRAGTRGARLRVIAWRSPAENEFMTTAERAAAPLLPNLPPRKSDAGQFAFADPRRVQTVLEESGWTNIEIRPINVDCTLPAEDLDRYLTRLGPVGLMLRDADEQARTRVLEAVRPAFAPYLHGAEVRFTSACWMVSAGAIHG